MEAVSRVANMNMGAKMHYGTQRGSRSRIRLGAWAVGRQVSGIGLRDIPEISG